MYLFVYLSLSYTLLALISCLYLFPKACCPSSVFFICPKFTSFQQSKSEESKLHWYRIHTLYPENDSGPTCLLYLPLEWITAAKGNRIPWLASVGSHAFSCWRARSNAAPPVWPGIWGMNSFPEERLPSRQLSMSCRIHYLPISQFFYFCQK